MLNLFLNDRKPPPKKMVKKVQQMLLKKCKNPKYRKYSKYEYSYWEHVLEWLYSDNINKKNLKVLDIGCAYGTLSIFCKMYLNAEVTAVDFMTDYYPQKMFEELEIKFIQTNIETANTDFETKFDTIILTEVLEHFNFNPIQTLKKIKSLLKENGILYLSTPNAKYWGKANYYEDLSNIPNVSAGKEIIDDHIWQYNISELLYVLNKAGFVVKELEYSNNGRQFNLALTSKLN